MDIKTIMPPAMSTKINMNRGFAKKSNLPDMMDALPAGMARSEAAKISMGTSLQKESMDTLNSRNKPMGNMSSMSGMAKSAKSKQQQY